MTDSRVALGMDRLPWLTDEPARARKRPGDFVGWAIAATLAVAGISYWLGTQTASEDPISRPTSAVPSATVNLPEPRVEPSETVRPVPPPEVSPVPAPEVRRVEPSPRASPPARRLPRAVPESTARRVKRTIATEEIERVRKAQAAPKPAAPVVRNTQNVKIWSSWQSAGAAGRVVQIGAFGTRQQAKLGWRHMVRAYPALRRLQAVTVDTRNSRRRKFYRFQIGTTSQAHSEVLCQRMRRIRFSCAVVGLPGARRAVER